MKKLLLFVLLLTSCGSAIKGSGGFEVVYKPSYAQRFELISRNDTLLLIVKDAWQGAQGQEMEFAIDTTAERFICMSSSHTAFMDALGDSAKVVGVSGREFLYSNTHSEKADVGYSRSLSYELIMGLKSDVMTVYEVGGENSSITDKLKRLGVNVVHIADFLENDPLGRAEWIVAFGAMTGKIEKAKQIFDSIEKRYNEIKVTASKNKLKIMLNSPYNDVWYMPGDSSYMIELIRDAGGDYLGKGVAEAKSRPISVETAYSMLLQADVWLNPSAHIQSLEQLKNENQRFKNINLNVFTNTKRSTPAGGSDFWESGVVKPDLILKDLIYIFNDCNKVKEDSLYFFKRLN